MFLRKTLRTLKNRKLETHVEEINKVGDKIHRVAKNYLGARLTRKNIGTITKKQLKKILATVESEKKKTVNELKRLLNAW
jgi:Glu-tRNA(Gln) amidotransferase subunit E-like FAD-binding protein